MAAQLTATKTIAREDKPAAQPDLFAQVTRVLHILSIRSPLLLAIDDLQWAEHLLLDLIEHQVQWGSGMPLLLLVAGRPELRDIRSTLVIPSGAATDVVTLAGLDSLAATRLAANVINTDALPAAVAGRILATSQGNPLFVGELVRMLVPMAR